MRGLGLGPARFRARRRPRVAVSYGVPVGAVGVRPTWRRRLRVLREV
jgi:hypothetical protein